MHKYRFAFIATVNLQLETDEELLHTGNHSTGGNHRIIKIYACIHIRKRHTVLLAIRRNCYTDTIVKVKFYPFNCIIYRTLRNVSVNLRLLLVLRRLLIRSLRLSRRNRPGRLRSRRGIYCHCTVIVLSGNRIAYVD